MVNTFAQVRKPSHYVEAVANGRALGPNEISIVDPDAVEVILGSRSKCTKGAWYDMGDV